MEDIIKKFMINNSKFIELNKHLKIELNTLRENNGKLNTLVTEYYRLIIALVLSIDNEVFIPNDILETMTERELEIQEDPKGLGITIRTKEVKK